MTAALDNRPLPRIAATYKRDPEGWRPALRDCDTREVLWAGPACPTRDITTQAGPSARDRALTLLAVLEGREPELSAELACWALRACCEGAREELPLFKIRREVIAWACETAAADPRLGKVRQRGF